MLALPVRFTASWVPAKLPSLSVVSPEMAAKLRSVDLIPLVVTLPAPETSILPRGVVFPARPLITTSPVPALRNNCCAPSISLLKVIFPAPVLVLTVTSPSSTTLPVNDTASLLVLMVVVLALIVVPVRVTVLADVRFAPLAMFRFVVAFRVTTPSLVVVRLLFSKMLPD